MKNIRFIFGLLLIVSGLILVYASNVPDANAQLQSNHQNGISGKYSDLQSGLQITFPDGWKGSKVDLIIETLVMLTKNNTSTLSSNHNATTIMHHGTTTPISTDKRINSIQPKSNLVNNTMIKFENQIKYSQKTMGDTTSINYDKMRHFEQIRDKLMHTQFKPNPLAKAI